MISAIEAGEPVVLTKHGRPVADITPRTTRVERMPNEVFLRNLGELRLVWEASGASSESSAYDVEDVLVDDADEAFGGHEPQ